MRRVRLTAGPAAGRGENRDGGLWRSVGGALPHPPVRRRGVQCADTEVPFNELRLDRLIPLVQAGNELRFLVPAQGRGEGGAPPEGEKLLPLFPPGQAPDAQALRDPVGTLERLSAQGWRGRLRLLPL